MLKIRDFQTVEAPGSEPLLELKGLPPAYPSAGLGSGREMATVLQPHSGSHWEPEEPQ